MEQPEPHEPAVELESPQPSETSTEEDESLPEGLEKELTELFSALTTFTSQITSNWDEGNFRDTAEKQLHEIIHVMNHIIDHMLGVYKIDPKTFRWRDNIVEYDPRIQMETYESVIKDLHEIPEFLSIAGDLNKISHTFRTIFGKDFLSKIILPMYS